uniref:Uncharacterized protein n=1 Tax=Rhizophora mucronata TaxID=61149 RepID=A0A2P2PYP8_RHIMU
MCTSIYFSLFVKLAHCLPLLKAHFIHFQTPTPCL